MNNNERYYYRASVILPSYLFMLGLAIYLVWDPLPSQRFDYLQHYPGSIVRYGLAMVLGFSSFWMLPTFVRSLFRIPAVQYDGRVLVVRGWEDRIFDLSSGQEIEIRVDEDGANVLISANGVKPARIRLLHIEGPTSLVRFLESLVVKQRLN